MAEDGRFDPLDTPLLGLFSARGHAVKQSVHGFGGLVLGVLARTFWPRCPAPSRIRSCSPDMNEKLGPFSKCADVRRGRQSRGRLGWLGQLGSLRCHPQFGTLLLFQRARTHAAAAGVVRPVCCCRHVQRQHVIALCLSCHVQGHVSMKPKRGDAIVFHSQKVGQQQQQQQRICQWGRRLGCSLP